MDLYTETSFQLAKQLTINYSTSFSKSSQLFDNSIRHHIFAIYGLVRVADEIVDTYKGTDATAILDELEAHTMNALTSGFSPNPLVHAFVTTARQYGIDKSLIAPFFESMRMDLTPQTYTQSLYETYIHGSAEVIGLMCLKVFCDHDSKYQTLEAGAKALGAAYQKVNFLRDMKADFDERGRVYFPNVEYETFDDAQKDVIISDIKKDFEIARQAVAELPANSRSAVSLSFALYSELLTKLEKTSADKIKKGRVSVSATRKLQLLVKSRLSKVDV
jgi:phytoene synthase